MEIDYSDLEGLTVYASVKCQNVMGLTNTTSSDGVKISNKSPSIDSAVVSPFYLSSSIYKAKDGYQSMSDTVRLKWEGFTDLIGIDNYLVSLSTKISFYRCVNNISVYIVGF
jgi:hypothetical protein